MVGGKHFQLAGIASPDMDAEVILLTARLWRELGIDEHVELQLNSIGSADARSAYRDALVAYLREHEGSLDEDSLRRLKTDYIDLYQTHWPDHGMRAEDTLAVLTELVESSFEHSL